MGEAYTVGGRYYPSRRKAPEIVEKDQSGARIPRGIVRMDQSIVTISQGIFTMDKGIVRKDKGIVA